MDTQPESLPAQPRQKTVVVLMTLGLAAVTAAVIAEQPAPLSAPDSAAEVAREILEIQQQLGGSIVPPLPSETERRSSGNSPRQATTIESRVDQLRDTAWQLDSCAHRLECNDLYRQADSLRGLAAQLREDARKMKQEAAKSE